MLEAQRQLCNSCSQHAHVCCPLTPVPGLHFVGQEKCMRGASAYVSFIGLPDCTENSPHMHANLLWTAQRRLGTEGMLASRTLVAPHECMPLLLLWAFVYSGECLNSALRIWRILQSFNALHKFVWFHFNYLNLWQSVPLVICWWSTACFWLPYICFQSRAWTPYRQILIKAEGRECTQCKM